MRKSLLLFVSFILLHANALPFVHYDPFYKSQKILHTSIEKKAEKKSLILNAIFNNKAFIDGKFYTIGDNIGAYKIKKINKEFVVIQNHKIIKVLRLQQKQHQLIIKQQKREKK